MSIRSARRTERVISSMFDWEMIRLCAELYPVDFFWLCVIAIVGVPLAAFFTIAMAVILIGKE